MRAKMDQMQQEFERFFEYLRTHAGEFSHQMETFSESEALIVVPHQNRNLTKSRQGDE